MPRIDLAIQLLLVALGVALISRWRRRPYTIALVIVGLILGLVGLLEPVHLSEELIMTVFLPPLLFEGALHIRAYTLRKRSRIVFGMALLGTLLTALGVGLAAHYLLGFDLLTAILLGVIVAPTDPVSVLATFRNAGVSRELSTIVESESLFNDGIAVVLYVIVLQALGGTALSPLAVIQDFVVVVGAGAMLGVGIGFLASLFLKQFDDHLLEVMVTLITVYGTYLLAEHLGVSGVIAVSISGIVVGNRGLVHTTPASHQSITTFWEIGAFLVNSVVFLLIGFELRPDHLLDELLMAALIWAALLLARAFVVYGLGALLHRRQRTLRRSWRHVIWWGGLRGAVPVALALGMPASLAGRDQLVGIVFGVVLLSLLGQGLTMPSMLRRLRLSRDEGGEDEATGELAADHPGISL